MAVPFYIKKYFWDTDPKKIDPRRRSQYVIERILEHGDEKAVRWMFYHFSKTKIKQTLMKRRGLSLLSANHWSAVLGLPKNKIICLRRRSQHKPIITWPY